MDLNRWDDLMLSSRSKTKNGIRISNGWHKCQEQLKEMLDMDKDYKWFMLTGLSEAENFKSLKRKRETPNDVGNESERNSTADPQYELFLGRLKLYEKSYMLEVEKNGVPMVIKYEELRSSKDVCVSKLQNKTKNFTGQKNVFAKEKPSLGDNWATKNQVEHVVKAQPNKKVQRQYNLQALLNKRGNIRHQHDIQTRDVKKHNVATFGNLRSTVKFYSGDNRELDTQAVNLSTANEKDSGKNKKKKKDNESDSDLEVLETADFFKEGNCVSILPSRKLDRSVNEDDFQTLGVYSEFRNKVINLMRKPFNRREYDELRQAVQTQKTEESNGVCTRSKKLRGKSYLNYYPDLHRKLKKFENDKERNLKTLRGFFFWLEHITMENSFKPWNDPECCAVEQEHRPPPHCPASHCQGRKKKRTSFEPGNNSKSVAVGQINCSPLLPPRSPRHQGIKREAISSKARNHHESVTVEKKNCQSPPPTHEKKAGNQGIKGEAISSKARNHHESVTVEKKNCQSPPRTHEKKAGNQGIKREAISSKARNHHESVTVEKKNCQSPPPTHEKKAGYDSEKLVAVKQENCLPNLLRVDGEEKMNSFQMRGSSNKSQVKQEPPSLPHLPIVVLSGKKR